MIHARRVRRRGSARLEDQTADAMRDVLNPSVAVPGEQQLENTLPSYRLLRA